MMRGYRRSILCPHCRQPAITMTSRELSPLVREIYLQCLQVNCGHRFVAHLGVVRTLIPSLNPSADVSLPIVERRANDILVARSPDNTTPPASITSSTSLKLTHHSFAPPALN